MADKKDDAKGEAPADLYYPPNRLVRAIGIGDGPSLREMEEAAEQRLKISKAIYKTILRDTISRMKKVMLSNLDPGEQQQAIFVDAHDIKGQATVLGYPLAGEIAASICAAIKEVPAKLREHPDLLNLHVNALDWAFANQHNEKRATEKSVLLKSLKDALE